MSDRARLETPQPWPSFLAALVHELETPLASLRMLADLLSGEAPPADGPGRRYIETIQAVTADIQELVGEAAEMAQLVTGKKEVRREGVALEALVREVGQAVLPRARERGIAVTELVAPGLPTALESDARLLRRALHLVLATAVCHAGSEVVVRLDLADGRPRIVLSSDGAPFPDTDPGVLFTPFHEGVRSSRTQGGRSLALPLAGEAIRLLGGTLCAANRGGRPTFELALPSAGGFAGPAAPAD